MTGIEVKPEFGYVIITAIVTCFHYEIQGIAAALTRQKIMTRQYIEKHLAAEDDAFKKEFGSTLGPGCNPDCGLGRLAAKLDFIDWIKVQNAQRAHLNYLEGLTYYMVNLLLAGLFFPVAATGFGIATLIGRQMYASGYRNNGPGGRVIGFQLATLSQMALMAIGIRGGLALAGVV